MNHARSDFLPDEVTAVDLSGWADILPAQCRVLGANLFADIFLADATGAIHMLQVSAASITKIARSKEEFFQRCFDDEDGWLLRPLVDRCRSAGMNPTTCQCYAFTTLPLFGGKYQTDNIWMCSWSEWISFTASIHVQTKDLPNGSRIQIRIVD
ncbi:MULTISPECIES: T6SS immunity protein Tdi1 domain-containing protein [Rhodomicrobium]|uniref:T6SS immunity protein Tdi1 domain-containing protein n=1 Tax=Rhodomicrobium TaxID=1068 RepID=UPI000B4BE4CD|nr:MULTISPECIES: T6SS immunity protein Tdi1 domain-containing protein [Rhodomicrobium]